MKAKHSRYQQNRVYNDNFFKPSREGREGSGQLEGTSGNIFSDSVDWRVQGWWISGFILSLLWSTNTNNNNLDPTSCGNTQTNYYIIGNCVKSSLRLESLGNNKSASVTFTREIRRQIFTGKFLRKASRNKLKLLLALKLTSGRRIFLQRFGILQLRSETNWFAPQFQITVKHRGGGRETSLKFLLRRTHGLIYIC